MTPTRTLILIAVGAACCAGAYLATKAWRRARRPATIEIGDRPEHVFKSAVTPRGPRALADLRGLPAYVLTWGTG